MRPPAQIQGAVLLFDLSNFAGTDMIQGIEEDALLGDNQRMDRAPRLAHAPSARPTSAKPTIIFAHVPDSGTAPNALLLSTKFPTLTHYQGVGYTLRLYKSRCAQYAPE